MEEINNLRQQRSSLIEKKYEYSKKIKEIETSIKEKSYEIANICKKNNNGHIWISEREDCLYGERYTFCKICEIDYYGGYFHN